MARGGSPERVDDRSGEEETKYGRRAPELILRYLPAYMWVWLWLWLRGAVSAVDVVVVAGEDGIG
jgi:hypothetical protein